MSTDEDHSKSQQEYAILTACALRIDGYRYADAHGLVLSDYTGHLHKVGMSQLTNDEILVAFFAYQRHLCKWGGVLLPKNHEDWRQFRELFFRAVQCKVPEAFIFHPDGTYEEWQRDYLPRLEACVQLVKEIHESTSYAPPDPSEYEPMRKAGNYPTIKALVLDFVHRQDGCVSYIELTDEVLHHFPESRWKESHWRYWRYQILQGKTTEPFSESELANLGKKPESPSQSHSVVSLSPLYPNLIADEQRSIAQALAKVSHHMHPVVVAAVKDRNADPGERARLEAILPECLEKEAWLYPGSACVFPGVRRFIGKVRKRELLKYVPKKCCIIDDNRFPRNVWTFLAVGEHYGGPNWKTSGLAQFELAHIFGHKRSQRGLEEQVFKRFDASTKPWGLFTCAGNVVLIPKGFAKPTDGLSAVRVAFFKRYIDLYSEASLPGLRELDNDALPKWYDEIEWNDPILPPDWEENLEKLFDYRVDRLKKLFARGEA